MDRVGFQSQQRKEEGKWTRIECCTGKQNVISLKK
jgi:hypothetical protein